MKFSKNTVLIYFLKISAIFSVGFMLETCQHFIINKTNKCKIKSYTFVHIKQSICVCRDMNVKPTWTNSTLQTIANFRDDFLLFTVYFKNKKPLILDKKLAIFDQAFFKASRSWKLFFFRYVKGFDVNSFNESILLRSDSTFLFYDSSLAFFSNGRRLKTCLDFPSKPRSFFQIFKSKHQFINYDVNFHVKNYQPVCPLAFSNTYIIRLFVFYQLSNTFYKTNIPTFLDLPKHITHINANINSLSLIGYGEISLSRRIINPHVFNLTKEFIFGIEISSIEKELFRSFIKLKKIQIYMHYWRKLAHKGIEWVYDLNSQIRVDLNDSAMIRKYFENSSQVMIWCKRRLYEIAEGLKPTNAFPDEDFCIYEKFPFEQMIVWYFDEYQWNFTQVSCTFVWLIHPKLIKYGLLNANPNFNLEIIGRLEIYVLIFDKCGFSERLQKCNKSDFHKKNFLWTYGQTQQLTFFIKFIFLIFMPIICLVGMFSNLIIIATVHYKPNQKEMKENQYSYMSLNSFCNLFILFFQSISLISECEFVDTWYGYGIFCSSVRKSVFSQFYRIIFLEYLTHVFYVMSNLSYICYSINRLSLIGQDHVLPLSKVFTFKPNYFRPEHNYPASLELTEISQVLVFLYLISNILYTLISSFGFVLANLVVDINILRAVKQVIAEREKNTSRAIQSNEIQKKKNENKSVNRLVLLIILNATFGLILKSFMSVDPIFTIYHQIALFNNSLAIYLQNVRTCSTDYVCSTIEALARNLILVNLAIPFFFFYKFDLKFKECLENLIANMKKKFKTTKTQQK